MVAVVDTVIDSESWLPIVLPLCSNWQPKTMATVPRLRHANYLGDKGSGSCGLSQGNDFGYVVNRASAHGNCDPRHRAWGTESLAEEGLHRSNRRWSVFGSIGWSL